MPPPSLRGYHCFYPSCALYPTEDPLSWVEHELYFSYFWLSSSSWDSMCSLRKGKYNQQFTCYNKSCSTAPCHLLPVGGYGVINERLRLNGGTSEGGSAEGEEGGEAHWPWKCRGRKKKRIEGLSSILHTLHFIRDRARTQKIMSTHGTFIRNLFMNSKFHLLSTSSEIYCVCFSLEAISRREKTNCSPPPQPLLLLGDLTGCHNTKEMEGN